MPASATKNRKANDWDVVVKANGMMAMRTLRGRFYDRCPRRQTENADIQKTADGGTENKNQTVH